MIKTYEQFGPPQNVLALPPHVPEKQDTKMVLSLKQIIGLEHGDIVAAGKRIEAICDSGSYIKLRHIGTSIPLILHNEPFKVMGVPKGQKFSVGYYNDIEVKDDSIVIYVRVDNSLYILSKNEMYEFTFIRPIAKVSAEDPYGEEDYSDT